VIAGSLVDAQIVKTHRPYNGPNNNNNNNNNNNTLTSKAPQHGVQFKGARARGD